MSVLYTCCHVKPVIIHLCRRLGARRDARTKETALFVLTWRQVLCALAEEVPSVIAGNDRMLGALFRMVRAAPPLDCVLAGYFSRLLGVLLTRCGEDVLAYLEVGFGVQGSWRCVCVGRRCAALLAPSPNTLLLSWELLWGR